MAKSDEGSLLARILETPQLARVVPQLPAAVLHRVIEHVGLEAAADLVALATPDQLRGIFDLDLWRSAEPGREEQFDPERFGAWLEMLVDTSEALAATTIARIDPELVTAALSHYIRVFDPGTFEPTTSDEGNEPRLHRLLSRERPTAEIGGYVLVAAKSEAWDAIVATLVALDADHGEAFQHIMNSCRALSNDGWERDGLHDLLDDSGQALFDLAVDRERRREQQGYVTPPQARAFLAAARRLRLDAPAPPAANANARAYFSAMRDIAADHPAAGGDADAPPEETAAPLESRENDAADAVASMMEVLTEAGVLQPPRALLETPSRPAAPTSVLRDRLQWTAEHDPMAFSARSEELAYLGNVLSTLCSVLSRPLTPSEASEAAMSVCTLGLENWPDRWRIAGARAERFLLDQDLIGVFQVGWTVLYEQVCLRAARRLVDVLGTFRIHDHDLQVGLSEIRGAMTRALRDGTPWHAAEELDVLMALDQPTWAALVGVIAECPVMHAGLATRKLLRIDPAAFEFISSNAQIRTVHAFLDALPQRLRGR